MYVFGSFRTASRTALYSGLTTEMLSRTLLTDADIGEGGYVDFGVSASFDNAGSAYASGRETGSALCTLLTTRFLGFGPARNPQLLAGRFDVSGQEPTQGFGPLPAALVFPVQGIEAGGPDVTQKDF